MIFNVPYFGHLPESIIVEMIYLLKSKRYEENEVVVKSGDKTNQIYFLKGGVMDVEMKLRNESIRFDSLNPGSCFCLFSSFDQNRKVIYDFRARSTCIIETLAEADITRI